MPLNILTGNQLYDLYIYRYLSDISDITFQLLTYYLTKQIITGITSSKLQPIQQFERQQLYFLAAMQ